MEDQNISMIDGLTLINIFEARAADAGVDFDRVCKRAGIRESTVWRWLMGHRWPNVHTIQRLNQSFRAEVAELHCH